MIEDTTGPQKKSLTRAVSALGTALSISVILQLMGKRLSSSNSCLGRKIIPVVAKLSTVSEKILC